MATFDGLLMRDTLQDNGVVPSPGYPYHSPDIIVHDQVANPEAYFTNNYSSDPNQPLQAGNPTNFVYVRTKNLSTSTKVGYYIHVYRANSSLFLNTGVWKNNKLTTRTGNDYIQLGSVAPEAIGVGSDRFILNAQQGNYCVIGIASEQQEPTIPGNFPTYNAYITWVRTNQNVCGRNLSIIRDYPNRSYSRLDTFTNPESSAQLVAFKTKASNNLPVGTSFGVQCAPAGVDKHQVITNNNASRILAVAGMAPANFDGTVTSYATLPSGRTWPPNSRLTTEAYVGRASQDEVARYATDFAVFGTQPHELGLPSNGVLVLLGSTGTEFIQ